MTIKEAAKRLQLEAHVLRYWEDELKLDIKRNAQGHRYYDERDIRLFESVKAMKEEGLMLRDIRNAILRAKRKQAETDTAEKREDAQTAHAYTGSADDAKEGRTRERIPDKMDDANREDAVCHEEESGGQGSKTGGENRACDQKNFEDLPLRPVHMRTDEDKDSMVERMECMVDDSDKVVNFKQAQLQSVMNRVIAAALRENRDIITSSIKEEVTADVMRQFDAVMREKEEREEARYRRLDNVLRDIQRANMEAAAAKEKRGFWKRRG